MWLGENIFKKQLSGYKYFLIDMIFSYSKVRPNNLSYSLYFDIFKKAKIYFHMSYHKNSQK